jgi:putative addiction module killer protein
MADAILKEIHEYVTIAGKSPFSEWLNSLRDVKGRAKVRIRLDRLRLGNRGDCKAVGSGVQELRIDFGPGYRVYFAEDSQALILLLCGGDKSTQSKDIDLAKIYWREYKRRKNLFGIL